MSKGLMKMSMDMLSLKMVVLYVLVAWMLKSFADNCSLFKKSCSDKDRKGLLKAESAFYAIAVGAVVLTTLMPMLLKKGSKLF